MSLASISRPSRTIENVDGQGTSLTVYALSTNTIAELIASQMSSMEELFGLVESMGVTDGASLQRANVADIGMRVMTQMPDFLAHAIAIAADEPQAWMNARSLKANKQVEVIVAIAKMTFDDVAGFQEFLGNVIGALRVARSAVPQAALLAHNIAANSASGSSDAERPSLS